MTAKIVIAEDDETTREVIELNLTDNGWDVVAFTDGDECWEHLESRTNDPPDIVVLDVMMPEIDGLSVLEHIRDHDALVDLPVVMLTSRNREEDIVQALDAGADDFVAKPFSEVELVSRVEKVLDEA
ncbi:DNA-binding response OmpR family regulator [Halorubrum alkaliphilum]|uniref:DNA-binding response OmpR family regulator n=1 Tax=Halorubrum alkaliphilum TaxID=261290 RepID=A0A8T4GHQ3_9EURY|nr:response regulator [Halorubrum alkaliphilum]MBP1924058.1 DNA-binding response OmpR family regulator [Halorubrum alkaliphilum]